MRIIYFGDAVGRSGRDAILTHLPKIKDRLHPDFCIINGENAAAGFGITPKICEDFFENGIDCIVLGNHAWDQKEIIPYIEKESRLLRPLNYPSGTPGKGHSLYQLLDGRKILVLQAMGRLFMDNVPLEDPFRLTESILKTYPLGASVQAILLDLHAETTSEKAAFAYYFDGRVSGVFGTHTHVPTADARVLPKGTAFQTDVGMCGNYDSVIGVEKEGAIARFLKHVPMERLSPAEGVGTASAIFFETDDKTGLCKKIAPLRVGGILPECWPDF